MLFLKDIGFGAATVLTGREFHTGTTRDEKKKLCVLFLLSGMQRR